MLHHRYLAAIEGDGTDTFSELVTMRGRDVELSRGVARRRAELELFDSPVEELTTLAPREMLGGYWRSVGTTFAGGETLTAPRPEAPLARCAQARTTAEDAAR